ncbi:MAG: translation initiation factor IF-2, partial [Candidatus Helarchaeota archaeon]|nr:translation initiation factor IF-2 [Candidatus Helarchaeota archaeon]
MCENVNPSTYSIGPRTYRSRNGLLFSIVHGKTSILDRIRGTGVQKREAAGITQHIGASFLPIETIIDICGPLIQKTGIQLQKINGLLVIDTPGHSAFINLRRRGGAVSDIAVLVIDINEGCLEQTFESLKILKERKTPFLIAANKIDRVPGWKFHDPSFLESFKKQVPSVQTELDNRIYEIMGTLTEERLLADRFDRVADFTQTIAIVPTSAKTGEGIPELLMVLAGLTTQYLQQRLKTSQGAGKGVVLEVKEEPGLGVTIDTILYDGVLKKGDSIIVGGLTKSIQTKIRALLLPKPLDEIRDPREKFSSIQKVSAAAGIKIAAPNLEDAVAGGPVLVVNTPQEQEEAIATIKSEIQSIRIDTDSSGIILKADTLGSLEALIDFLKEEKVQIRKADVGSISKRDITEATIVKETDPLSAVILAFHTKILPDAKEEAFNQEILIFENDVIYRLIEEYLDWVKEKEDEFKTIEYDKVKHPSKILFLPQYIFRRSDPAVIGIRVLGGTIRPKTQLINKNGKIIGVIRQIQDKSETIARATKNQEVAISIAGGVVGRNIKETK